MRKPKAPPRIALTLIFALVVFCIFLITMFIVGTVIYFLTQAGVLDDIDRYGPLIPIIIFSVVSILTGTIVATIMSSIPLKPVNKLIGGLNNLAAGNYETRMRQSNHPVGKDIEESFNLLAEELQNTEMLRSDFVNNLSHEFKTPIVSIRGFAKLLQKESLTETQHEYLQIIIEESVRLADMAANMLDLAKVENQRILTDVTRMNLSEQMRDCILLLENKWCEKNLTIRADFEEHFIGANEELLKQVWINLLDNAIKFSLEQGEIVIDISKSEYSCTVSIENDGPEISESDRKRIFNKYWQGDISHSSEGTGIGLSIVRRIVELHSGSINVNSTSHKTVFSVVLPNE